MKKALIVNTVMVNNGDAGLVTNLARTLSSYDYSVTIATYNYQFSVKNYKGFRFCKDIVGSSLNGPFKMFAYLMIPILMLVNSSYRSADMIIGAPGGYINSYYGFRWNKIGRYYMSIW